MYDFEGLKSRLLAGYQITEDEAYQLAELDDGHLAGLMSMARALTEHYFHNQVSLCAIWPAKTGYCGGDCAFCAQSARHHCEIEINRIEDIEVSRVQEHIKKMRGYDVSRFAGGRENALGEAEYRGYLSGVNAAIFGHYLTTQGRGYEEGLRQLRELGLHIT